MNKHFVDGQNNEFMHESTKRLWDYAVASTKGSEDPVRTWADLQRRLQISSATATNWKRRGVSQEGALAAEAQFGCTAVWVLRGVGHMFSTSLDPVAQQLSDSASILPPKITWEGMRMGELPDVFEVELPDDAMAPRAKAGQLIRIDKREEPRYGDGVLVIDRKGKWYFRIYTQSRDDTFEARAENPSFLTLSPRADGIRVAGVMVGLLQQRWA